MYFFFFCFPIFCLDTPKKNQGGVNFYQHFRKDYVRPYGLTHAEDSFQDTTVANRLKSFNCEFLLRPNVGISEFSETVLENAKYIKENMEIFDAEAIQKFLRKTDGIMEHLQTVNRKDKSGSGKTISIYCIMF